MTIPARRVPIDVTFDVRTDAGSGDPDSTSATLRQYHQLLWSKELPVGGRFDLVSTRAGTYLHHTSGLGEFFPTSDTVIPGFFRYKRMAHIIDQLSQREIDRFLVANHTIGAMMIFPGDRRPGVVTINGARGFNSKIADRFDFTVEAIRRYYLGLPSPLSKTIAAYDDFFRLFVDFRGYIDFFLLQDMVATSTESVRFFTPFDDFGVTPPLPCTVEEWRSYRDRALDFIKLRNRRIATWARANLAASKA